MRLRSRTISYFRRTSRGFTLVEVLAVIAILGIVTSLMLFQYRQFDSQLLLRNLAYEIALTIREAQTLGIGVRGSGGVFTYSHGVHFATGTAYFLFRDANDNGRYDGTDTILNRYTIERRNTISNLCVGSAPLSGGECNQASLDILFERPDPDAFFYPTPSASDAQITVTSSSGTTRTIDITATGQVSVQ
jgi:prepilin-type N-terminal cleavage/methylation domain-containing protein